MPANKETTHSTQMRIPRWLAERVGEWRHERRLPTLAEAYAQLIAAGLESRAGKVLGGMRTCPSSAEPAKKPEEVA